MKSEHRSGGALAVCVFSIALIGSLALNVAFMADFEPVRSWAVFSSSERGMNQGRNADSRDRDVRKMKKAAGFLGIRVSDGMTSDDILQKIENAVSAEVFGGELLTDDQLKDVDAMLGKDAGASLRKAQKFLSGIKDRKIIIVEGSK